MGGRNGGKEKMKKEYGVMTCADLKDDAIKLFEVDKYDNGIYYRTNTYYYCQGDRIFCHEYNDNRNHYTGSENCCYLVMTNASAGEWRNVFVNMWTGDFVSSGAKRMYPIMSKMMQYAQDHINDCFDNWDEAKKQLMAIMHNA